jgi:peptide/nickel transport system permease protein
MVSWIHGSLLTEHLELGGIFVRILKLLQRTSKGAIIGVFFLVVLVLGAVCASYIFPGDPDSPNLSKIQLPPSLQFPLGTDYLGRDQLALIIYGARTTLIVAATATSILAILGTTSGLLAGYFGRNIDGLLMRIADAFLTIPTLPLVVLVVAIFGANLVNVVLMIGLTRWPSMARIVRADTLSLMKREFIEVESVMGAHPLRTIFKHLLPNQLNSILVYASLNIPIVIITEASIEFLGLAPLSISWGFMINAAMNYWMSGAWWMSFFPGLAIFLTSLSFYLASEGLKEALNPKLMRKRESVVVQIGGKT